MMSFEPFDSHFEARVRSSFSRQTIMTTLGAQMKSVEPGKVVIEMPFRADLSQQDGFVHAGVIATILDSACGYSAYSLMPEDASPLTVEFKISLIRPAVGECFVAKARVIKPGRNLTFCEGEVFSVSGTEEKTIATMSSTMMNVRQSN